MTHLLALLPAQPLAALAQAAAPAEPRPSFFDGPTILVFSVLIVFFYLLVIRPGNKDRQKREELLSAIKKGTKVVTAGGIHGEVVDATDKDTVVLEIAKNTKIKINRSSISVVNTPESDEAKK